MGKACEEGRRKRGRGGGGSGRGRRRTRGMSGSYLALNCSRLRHSTHAQAMLSPAQGVYQRHPIGVAPLPCSRGRRKSQPIFVFLMQALQVLHLHANFFLPGSTLHAAHADVWGRPQVDEPIWDERWGRLHHRLKPTVEHWSGLQRVFVCE